MRPMTAREQLSHIKEWFIRHRRDYCDHCAGPPLAWSEYFAWLLAELELHQAADAVDPHAASTGTPSTRD